MIMTYTPKIAFFDTKPYDKEVFQEVNKEYNFEITFHKFHITPENVVLTKGYDAICVFVNDILDSPTIEALKENGVKLIALRSAGINNVDFKAAYENKIHVVRVPAYSPAAIAEHTVALMLSLNRKIHRAYFRTRDSNFSLDGLMGFDMKGKTAGVIGTGKIGKALIHILRGFGMNVIAYDVYPDQDFARETGCTYVELDELFKSSDVISLNCPLTKQTEYIINKENIDKMKDGVMLINTGRGKLIKTTDLIEALKTKKIGSAGLDVYEEENAYFFEDFSQQILTDDVLARLLTFNNVIITSHQGFFTREALHNIAGTTMNNILSWARGDTLIENEICYRCMKYPDDCHRDKGEPCFED
jgi:D-lactate dehydrogenase